MTVTIPGNLLLLGEYAVLEEGGLGVALALERRVVIRVRKAPQLDVLGSWGGTTVHWSEQQPESSVLFSEVLHACRGYLAENPPECPAEPSGTIQIDSSPLYVSSERKGGYGSSAAVTVGLAWTILLLGGMDAREVSAAVPEVALRAHRSAQGGGSGYDIYTSAHGGVGMFAGGPRPTWQARRIPWLPELYLLRGLQSVSTPRAAERYREWKHAFPVEACGFLERSNSTVEDFLAAGSWREAEGPFRRGRELGLWLGDRIGVPARIEAPEPWSGVLCKAVGAGNELGVAVEPPAARSAGGGSGAAASGADGLPVAPSGVEVLVPARQGVVWKR